MASVSLGQSGRVCITTLCVHLRFSVSIRKNVPASSFSFSSFRLRLRLRLFGLGLGLGFGFGFGFGFAGNTACHPSARSLVVARIYLDSIQCESRRVRVSSRRRTERPRNEFGVRRVPALLKAVVARRG